MNPIALSSADRRGRHGMLSAPVRPSRRVGALILAATVAGLVVGPMNAAQATQRTTAQAGSVVADKESRSAACDRWQANRNRTAAVGALTGLFGGDPASVDQHFARSFRNHNPGAPKDAFTGYKQIAEALRGSTFRLWEPLRTIASGDLVAVQGLYHVDSVKTNRPDPTGPGVVAVDLFRFQRGMIVEHWDGLQDVVPPQSTPDNNDMIGGATGTPGRPLVDPQLIKRTMVQLSRGNAAVAQQFSPAYVNHNPFGADGRTGVTALAKLFGQAGFQMYTPVRAFADGDLVVLHGIYHFKGTDAPGTDRTGPGVVGFDIFRVKNGKIVEHWDVLQNNIPASATASGLPMI